MSSGLGVFYRDMTVPERRTFWACFMGWMLDGMDFMVYPLVIGTVITLWQIDRGTAGLAVTLTLLFSALGGWGAGYLSDRIGRVRTLQITIRWFSCFSLLSAFAQDFNQLMVCRALLGIGFGGEWAAGAVLIGETIRAEYRGRAVGCVQSGWALGWGLAVLIQAVLFSVLPAEEAWRWMFAFGAAPALLVFYVRRNVAEPAIAQRTRASGERAAIWEIFRPQVLRTTLLASLLGVGAQGGYYAITTWLPTYLRAIQPAGRLYRFHAGFFPQAAQREPACLPVRPSAGAVSFADHAGNLRAVHFRAQGNDCADAEL
jgi:MFS family permease